MFRATTRRQAGFTLVELLVTLAVVVSLTMATLVAGGNLIARVRVRTAAATVASTLRKAQALAIRQGRQVSVPFDRSLGRYLIFDPAEAATRGAYRLPSGVGFSRPDGLETITLSPPDAPERAALFNHKGLLLSDESTPGYVYVGNRERQCYRRVRVGAAGTVGVEIWDGRRWKN